MSAEVQSPLILAFPSNLGDADDPNLGVLDYIFSNSETHRSEISDFFQYIVAALMAIEDVNRQQGVLIEDISAALSTIPFVYIFKNMLDDDMYPVLIDVMNGKNVTDVEKYYLSENGNDTNKNVVYSPAVIGKYPAPTDEVINISSSLNNLPFLIPTQQQNMVVSDENKVLCLTPRSDSMAKIFVEYLKWQGIDYVFVLYDTHEDNISFVKDLQDIKFSGLHIHFVYSQVEDGNDRLIEEAMMKIISSRISTIVVVINGSLEKTSNMLNLAHDKGLFGPKYSWIIIERNLYEPQFNVRFSLSEIDSIIEGIGVFAPIIEKEAFVAEFQNRSGYVWETLKNNLCEEIIDTPIPCKMNSDEFSEGVLTKNVSPAFVYDAIVAVSLASDRLTWETSRNLTEVHVYDELLRSNFPGVTGNVTFDPKKKDRKDLKYQMMNFQRHETLFVRNNFNLITTAKFDENKFWIKYDEFKYYDGSTEAPSSILTHENMNFIGPMLSLGYIILSILGVCISCFMIYSICQVGLYNERAQRDQTFFLLLSISTLIMFAMIPTYTIDDQWLPYRILDILCNTRYWILIIAQTICQSAFLSKVLAIKALVTSDRLYDYIWATHCLALIFTIFALMKLAISDGTRQIFWARLVLEVDEYGLPLSSSGSCFWKETDHANSIHPSFIVFFSFFVTTMLTMFLSMKTMKDVRQSSINDSYVSDLTARIVRCTCFQMCFFFIFIVFRIIYSHLDREMIYKEKAFLRFSYLMLISTGILTLVLIPMLFGKDFTNSLSGLSVDAIR